MTTTLQQELTASDLAELGIDPPRSPYWEAYRNDEDTITILVVDEDGGSLDPPNVDHSGENAWEWRAFRNGQERDAYLENSMVCAHCGAELMVYGGHWLDDIAAWNYGDDEDAAITKWSHCPASGADPQVHVPSLRPTDVLIERYEHGQVVYAPIGEASYVDRQWDVAYGVAVMSFTKPDTIGPDDDPDKLLNFARGVCEEYTSWCNGDVYGMIRYELKRPDVPPVPFLTIEDFAFEWRETDSCCGFIGYRYAAQTAKSGDW